MIIKGVNMNWLSHWDKNLEHVEKIESLQESSVILACYEAPSEKEINTEKEYLNYTLIMRLNVFVKLKNQEQTI